MKTLTLSLALLFASVACVTTSAIPRGVADVIPSGARAVNLYSDQSATAYYRVIYRALAERGFGITQGIEALGTFSTEWKDIGQETTLRLHVFVRDTVGGSVASLRGQWGLTATMAAGLSAGFGASVAGGTADEAHWKGIGRPKVAFGQLAMIATDIPHSRLVYLSN